MASLKEKISTEVKAAMKGGDDLRLLTLRMLQSTIQNRELEKRAKVIKEKDDAKESDWVLEDEEVLAVVRSERR